MERKGDLLAEVTLMQMLEAREKRAARQASLIQQYGKALISFSLDIPGPVKNSPLIRRSFWVDIRELEQCVPERNIISKEMTEVVTGREAILVVDMEPMAQKAITTGVEDEHGLGRLYDMDVIGLEFQKLDREAVDGFADLLAAVYFVWGLLKSFR